MSTNVSCRFFYGLDRFFIALMQQITHTWIIVITRDRLAINSAPIASCHVTIPVFLFSSVCIIGQLHTWFDPKFQLFNTESLLTYFDITKKHKCTILTLLRHSEIFVFCDLTVFCAFCCMASSIGLTYISIVLPLTEIRSIDSDLSCSDIAFKLSPRTLLFVAKVTTCSWSLVLLKSNYVWFFSQKWSRSLSLRVLKVDEHPSRDKQYK